MSLYIDFDFIHTNVNHPFKNFDSEVGDALSTDSIAFRVYLVSASVATETFWIDNVRGGLL